MPGETSRQNGKKGGRPVSPNTLDKVLAREELRRIVIAAMPQLLRAQLAHAQGIGHLYTRDKTGKFTKIENQAQADQLLTEGAEGEDYWIFMKDPSVQAFTDLMNRALDKPVDAVTVEHSGGIDIGWKGKRP
jgi:hypothetical protein